MEDYPYPGKKGFHRETCIEPLAFDENNRIQPVQFTERVPEVGGYLFVHFIGEQEDGEQVYFAVSRDGLHWRDLRSTPVLRSNVGMCGVRDPFAVRDPKTGRVYLMATDLRIAAGLGWGAAQYEGSRDIVIWESDDLIHWSEPRAVTVAIPEAGCAWAPEAVYDPEKEAFFVFFASMVKTGDDEPKQRIYASYTKDFRTFTPPVQYIERPKHIIDTTIVQSGGKFWRVSGDNSTGRLLFEVSDSLTGKFEIIPSETLTARGGLEGPEMFLLPDGRTWCLIADQYQAGLGYLPMVTDALGTTDFRVLEPGEYDMGSLKKRHGGVLRITGQEYARLVDFYGEED